MDGNDWQGRAVCACDASTLGMVVGMFAKGAPRGPAAGARRQRPGPPRDGTAVYAIPRYAVVSRGNGCLWLGMSLSQARSQWLMHIVPWQKA